MIDFSKNEIFDSILKIIPVSLGLNISQKNDERKRKIWFKIQEEQKKNK